MPDPNIASELEAIKTITDALETLAPAARLRVLNYTMGHLGISDVMPSPNPLGTPPTPPVNRPLATPRVTDIRAFKEAKNPTSAVQMATLVAYYLAELAPADERKESISTKDMEKYFKQAQFPLSSRTEFTLPNTRTAGYLESAGRGRYKLNPIGHNLIAHNLPKSEDAGSKARSKRGKTAKNTKRRGARKKK